MIQIRQHADGLTILVRIHPRARREGISGQIGDVVKLEVTAPPAGGQANEACIRFFARLLKVPQSSITIAAGVHSRNKLLRITGVGAAVVFKAIATELKEIAAKDKDVSARS